jgi:RNase P/RNase MRP subunit POP5
MPRNPHRYILVKFLCSDSISAEAVQEATRSSIEDLLGKLGTAEMRVRMIGFEEGARRAVFRCDLKSVERLRAALALMTHVDGKTVAAMTTRSSGTIKALDVRLPRRRR